MRDLIMVLGPGAAILHMAWLLSFWLSRGVTWPTLVSGVVDVSLLYLTGAAAFTIIRGRLAQTIEQ
jgi:hypothetical protein